MGLDNGYTSWKILDSSYKLYVGKSDKRKLFFLKLKKEKQTCLDDQQVSIALSMWLMFFL